MTIKELTGSRYGSSSCRAAEEHSECGQQTLRAGVCYLFDADTGSRKQLRIGRQGKMMAASAKEERRKAAHFRFGRLYIGTSGKRLHALAHELVLGLVMTTSASAACQSPPPSCFSNASRIWRLLHRETPIGPDRHPSVAIHIIVTGPTLTLSRRYLASSIFHHPSVLLARLSRLNGYSTQG